MVKLGLLASTPDFAEMDFAVKVLMGSLEEIAHRAVALRYDGIEFMPGPESVPDPERMRKALQEAAATLLAVNSGRFRPQGLCLFGGGSARPVHPPVSRRCEGPW